MSKYDGLSQEQLKEELVKLEAKLADELEDKDIVVGQEGVHLPFGTMERFEDEIKEINSEIAEVKELLNEK